MTTSEEKQRIISAARAICWEAFGAVTEDLNNLQCVIRAAVWMAQYGDGESETFLDLAEEMAGELGEDDDAG